MTEAHFVIIGNGPAGHEAALTLKAQAPRSRITLVSRDRCGCYQPHLLPDWMAGKVSESDLFVSNRDAYEAEGIKLRSGQEVVHLDPRAREVILDHREIISFDGAIVAVGGRPRIPEPLARFRECMHTLKTLEDARAWIETLPGVNSLLVIGGDLTSLAVTRAMLDLGKEVFFVPTEEAFWPLRSSQGLFEEVAHRLRRSGARVLQAGKVRRMHRTSDRAVRVLVGDQEVEVDMVGAFFGLVPDIGFLARSGLPLDRGILVDEYLCTEVEDIYATGDCAQIYHPGIRDYWVSIGHDNARALGRIAALNLIGARVKAEVAPTRIFDVQGINVNTSWWTGF